MAPFFFVEHHFSHNCKKKHFSTTANSVYFDFNRTTATKKVFEKKKGSDENPWGVEIYLEQNCWFSFDISEQVIFECSVINKSKRDHLI